MTCARKREYLQGRPGSNLVRCEGPGRQLGFKAMLSLQSKTEKLDKE